MKYDVDFVGKIGSMALIDAEFSDIDYNKFARIGRELTPGMIWISSGAAEIGRLDFIKRNGTQLVGNNDEIKTDYASQGQAILMQTYRNCIDSRFSIRQLLVEHHHFNDPDKKEHIKKMLLRCIAQNAIPIINYNDAVCAEETRKMEIESLRKKGNGVVELVDNDETAAQIACLLKAKTLLILTNADGIYADPKNPSTIISAISGKNIDEVLQNIDFCKKACEGASRQGAGGARAKLEYCKEPVKNGTTVIIANAKYRISDILSGKSPSTKIGLG